MIGYITLLRAITMFFVVLIHVTSPILSQDLSTTWWVGNVFDSISRWSVPVYIMISGALLLNKEEPISVFFKKRGSKLLVPFLFWVTFYTFWKHRDDLSGLSFNTFINDWISDDSFFHLWFLFMLIGLYLAVPILRKITQSNELTIPIYFVIIWLAVEPISSIINRTFDISHGFRVELFSGFFGYFVLGYVLSKIRIKIKYELIIYILGVFGLLVTIFGTYSYTVEQGSFSGYWYEYLTFTTVLVSIAVFVFFKQRLANYKPSETVTLMSTASFGIYLIHPLLRDIFSSQTFANLIGFNINYKLGHPIFGVLITLVCIYVVSFIAVYIIRKIPFLRRIF